MHPILFRLPLPHSSSQWTWFALAVAGLLIAFGIVQFVVYKQKSTALVAVGLGLLAIGARFGLKASIDAITTDNIPIYSYGVMLGTSLVVGWYLTLGLAERDGLPKETMANNYVVTAVAAVVGSRVLYILTNLHEFQDGPASWFALRRGGLVAYGGFLGGLAGSYFFLKRAKIPLLPWADVAVPSLASGLMITRIGCYMFGCDFGGVLPEKAPGWLRSLGTFPHWPEGMVDNGSGSPAFVQHMKEGLVGRDAAASLPVHPTQIYESLVGVSLLALLLLARRKQKFRGQIFFLFTFAYGVCRYLLEILRDDAERGAVPFSLPIHQLIPFGLAIFAIGFAIGFSQMIENLTLRRVAQVFAFVPAAVAYVVMKPESFAEAPSKAYSTSQAIGLVTGFAACVAFNFFYKAALAHPEAAMRLILPLDPKAKPDSARDDDDEDDEDDDEEDEAPKAKPAKSSKAKPASKAKGKARPKAKAEPAEEDAKVEAKKVEAESQADEEPKEASKDEDEDKPEPAKEKKKDETGDAPAKDKAADEES